jgi:SAM-dependent methyltransferase
MNNDPRSEEILWRHLRGLPYFRAMLRAVEDSFYKELDLPSPVLDLGSGDGHFASVAFDHPLDVGLDPWWGPLLESRQYNGIYRALVRADGAHIPFPDGHFQTVVSTSVLEHIPHIQAVLNEVGRVVRPGGQFIFCVPNHRFTDLLLGVQFFRRLGLENAARAYGRFFNRIARHQHLDSPEDWSARLAQAGFHIVRHWHYFPEDALHRLEVGHVLGLPALVSKKLTGRWILSQSKWSLWPAFAITRPAFRNPISEQGACTFYITERVA